MLKFAELSTNFKAGEVGHLKMVNKCIKMIKEEKVEIKFPKLEEKLQLIGFCDASRH